MNETRTCIGNSEVRTSPASRAATGPAGSAASPGLRLRPSSGHPRRAASPHAKGGEDTARDLDGCCRTEEARMTALPRRMTAREGRSAPSS